MKRELFSQSGLQKHTAKLLPVVSQGDVKVIPNVLGIILLAAQSATAALLSKTGPESESKIPKGKRLESR